MSITRSYKRGIERATAAGDIVEAATLSAQLTEHAAEIAEREARRNRPIAVLAYLIDEHGISFTDRYPDAVSVGAGWYVVNIIHRACHDLRGCSCQIPNVAAFTADLTARPLPDYENADGCRLSVTQDRRIGVATEISDGKVCVKVEKLGWPTDLGETITKGHRRNIVEGDEVYVSPTDWPNLRGFEAWAHSILAAGRAPSAF
jgi:hypothetical protein